MLLRYHIYIHACSKDLNTTLWAHHLLWMSVLDLSPYRHTEGVRYGNVQRLLWLSHPDIWGWQAMAKAGGRASDAFTDRWNMENWFHCEREALESPEMPEVESDSAGTIWITHLFWNCIIIAFIVSNEQISAWVHATTRSAGWCYDSPGGRAERVLVFEGYIAIYKIKCVTRDACRQTIVMNMVFLWMHLLPFWPLQSPISPWPKWRSGGVIAIANEMELDR